MQDCEAYRLRGNEQGWQIVGSMESKGRPGMGEAREESALNMFRQMDLKGKSSKDDTQLKTVHQNTIATIRSYNESGGNVRKFSSKSTMLKDTMTAVNEVQRAVSTVGWLFGQLDSDE